MADKDAPEKIPAKRYTDVNGMKPGDVAKSTVYADREGKVSDKEPVEGRIVVAEGDTVNQAMIDNLNYDAEVAAR